MLSVNMEFHVKLGLTWNLCLAVPGAVFSSLVEPGNSMSSCPQFIVCLFLFVFEVLCGSLGSSWALLGSLGVALGLLGFI